MISPLSASVDLRSIREGGVLLKLPFANFVL